VRKCYEQALLLLLNSISMYTKLILPVVLLLISSSTGCNSFKSTDLRKTPQDVARLITADLLSGSDFMMYNTPGVSAVHYAEVCTAYGAIKFAGIIKDKETINNLVIRYNRVINENITNTANHVDVNVYGILPLEIFIQTKEKKYLTQGLEFADGQWENPLPDGLTSQTRYWIDDIYMIGCLQVQAYRATGNMIYLERAASEIDSYIQKLQQPNGLFYHGIDAPFFWGRGNGWVAAGFAELLSVLPGKNPHYSSILNGYKRMMKTLLDYQSDDGMWHQLIDKPESFKETSSTAMFGFAMSLGVQKGLLPKEPYTTAYIKTWNSLTEYLNEDGKIREVCIGTGQSRDVNYYLNRPRTTGDFHGQAPMLWFACTLIDKNY
jgi:unsaturated rhamnogalacturonyl hydrolase